MRHIADLPQTKILCSERSDGDFRGQPTVAYFFNALIEKPIHFTHLQLEHGVVVANPGVKETMVVADAAIIQEVDQGLTMVVGDCFPIVMVDQEAQVLAMIHGGWRSLAAGIVSKTLTVMQARGAHTNSVWVWIGPGARSCCYRSQQQPMQTAEHDWSSVIKKVPSFEQEKNSSKTEWSIDLPGYIFNTLIRNGVQKNHVIDEQICTICHPSQYFSHQRSKRTGELDGRFLVAAYWHSNSANM